MRISRPDVSADVKRRHNTSGFDLGRRSHGQVAAYWNGQITNKRGLRANRINRKKKEICFANIIKSFVAFSHSCFGVRRERTRISLLWWCSTNPQGCVESCNPGEINWEDFGRESPEGGWPGHRDAGDMLSPSRACNRDLVDEEGPCGMVWGEVRASHGVPRRTDQQTKSWLGNSLCALRRSGRARDGGS